MRVMSRSSIVALFVLFLLACAALAGMSAEKTDPEDGAVLSRPPSSLRVWFSEPPVVDQSELTLTGPTGELSLVGLHTMGADDLMVRIEGRVIDGEYEATWKTVDASGEEKTGSWSFTVKRGG